MSGPLPEALAPVTAPLSWLYGGAVRWRNRRFDSGRREIARLDRPVISVGNITTGGTGKSPMVATIVRWLQDAGHHPVIAMRGYRASPDGPGDEEAEHRSILPGVEVVADPDRTAALRRALPELPGVDVIVLDDGFQHRQIARDLDLVLIDATRDTLRDRLLPAGHLREPLKNLQRADGVIVTRADEVDDRLAERIARHHGRPPRAWSRHVWTGLDAHGPESETEVHEIDWLRGRRVITMLGVGHPRAIERQLERCGAAIAARVPARDHERYDRAKLETLRGLAIGAEAVVVTGKDWVKLAPRIDWARWPVPFVVPRLSIEFIAGEEALRQRVLEVAGAFPARASSSSTPRPHASPLDA